MLELDRITDLPIFTNTPVQWLIAVSVVAVVLIALITARKMIRTYYKRMQGTERTELLEIPLGVLSRTTFLFFIAVSLFVGLQTLTMGPTTARVLKSVITIALFWQAGVWAVAAASAWIDRKRRRSMTVDRAMVGSLGVIAFMINVLIWSLVVLLTLDNLGVDITALVAGLGIGGIAVALALQIFWAICSPHCRSRSTGPSSLATS